MQRLEDTSTPVSVGIAILGYSLCSSTLLLANKMAIEHLPVPSVVSFIQILSSAVFILIIKLFGVQVDNLEWEKVKSYSLYIVAFVAAIYANMQALAHSNVETVIVFRACSPVAVSIVEYLFMDRAWPSLRSSISLATVARIGGSSSHHFQDPFESHHISRHDSRYAFCHTTIDSNGCICILSLLGGIRSILNTASVVIHYSSWFGRVVHKRPAHPAPEQSRSMLEDKCQ